MADRANVTIALLALAATFAVIPASVDLIRDSAERRAAIAVLRTPRAFHIRGTQILDPAMYHADAEPAETSEKAIQLVSIVAGPAEAEAVLRVWDAVKADSLIRSAEMSVLLCELGERTPETISTHVPVRYVKDPEAFSARTGIRVVPFSLIIGGRDNVLAAGPGLPDESFIRDAAERFMREGPSAATRFRAVTLEMNSSLRLIEALFPSNAGGR